MVKAYDIEFAKKLPSIPNDGRCCMYPSSSPNGFWSAGSQHGEIENFWHGAGKTSVFDTVLHSLYCAG